MTDVLVERFEALGETSSWDWDDVRRRARRARLRVAVPAAAVTAATVAAAAVAATSGWLFQSSPGFVTARAQVRLDGHSYAVVVTQRTHRSLAPGLCMRWTWAGARPGNACTAAAGALAPGKPAGWVGGNANVTGVGARVGRGEIWWGSTPAEIARIVVTDAAGSQHGTATIAAPGRAGRFRFWAVAFDGRARRVAALDARGRVVATLGIRAVRR